jgi:hypothetical protein
MYRYILVFTSISIFIQLLRGWGMQDTVVVVQPYPCSITDDLVNVPFADCLYALPQLFFKSPDSYWLTVP